MKFKLTIIFLLISGFVGVSASDDSDRSNTPNLMLLVTNLESIQGKGSVPFYSVAGQVSSRAEDLTDPAQQKCAAHVLSLVNQLSLTTSPGKRAFQVKKFSQQHSHCDQFIPGFVCGQSNVVHVASSHN